MPERIAPRPICNVMIGVITYKRPESLRRLLSSIRASRSNVRWRVTVVDNDPARSGHAVLQEFDSSQFSYHTEARPGIPAARNKSLDLLEHSDDAIIFVDDDETVPPDWLDHLVGFANRDNADIVAGPVISILPPDAPDWLVKGTYFQHPVRKTGTTRGIPATNNTLVRRSVIEQQQVRFNDAYRASGGSDSAFFLTLHEQGYRWVWCAEAFVHEHVQVERIDRRWLFWRYVRGGEVYTRLPTGKSKLRMLLEAGLLTCGAIAYLPLALLFPRRRRNLLVLVARPVGIVRGIAKYSTKEYWRPDFEKEGQ